MKRQGWFLFLLLLWAGVARAVTLVVAFAFPEGALPAEDSSLTVKTTANLPNTQTGSEPLVTTKRYRGGATQAIVVDFPIERSALSGLTTVSHTLTYTTAEGAEKTLSASGQRVLSLPYASHAEVVSRGIAQGDTTNFNVAQTLRVSDSLTVESIVGPNANTADVPVESVTVREGLNNAKSMVIGTQGVATAEANPYMDSKVADLLVSGNLTLTAEGTLFPLGHMTGTGSVPMDTIIAWTGEGSPNTQVVNEGEGWVYCDGSYGTPDLRGLFMMGTSPAHSVAYKSTGGAKEVTFTSDHLPKHRHKVKIRQPLLKTYSWWGSDYKKESGSIWSGGGYSLAYGSSAGSSNPEAQPNLPPYVAVKFYQWKGVAE